MQREAILKENITGVFFRYVTPGVIGMVGLSLYILADTYFIANGVGELGLAVLSARELLQPDFWRGRAAGHRRRHSFFDPAWPG